MQKLTEHIDFYYDQNGLMVLTEKYHLERGYCCGNGCRHCPYNHLRVPQAGKDILNQPANGSSNKEERTGGGVLF